MSAYQLIGLAILATATWSRGHNDELMRRGLGRWPLLLFDGLLLFQWIRLLLSIYHQHDA